MAEEKCRPAKPAKDRTRDVEDLATRLFAAWATTDGAKTPEFHAEQALVTARKFFQVCDKPHGG